MAYRAALHQQPGKVTGPTAAPARVAGSIRIRADVDHLQALLVRPVGPVQPQRGDHRREGHAGDRDGVVPGEQGDRLEGAANEGGEAAGHDPDVVVQRERGPADLEREQLRGPHVRERPQRRQGPRYDDARDAHGGGRPRVVVQGGVRRHRRRDGAERHRRDGRPDAAGVRQHRHRDRRDDGHGGARQHDLLMGQCVAVGKGGGCGKGVGTARELQRTAMRKRCDTASSGQQCCWGK